MNLGVHICMDMGMDIPARIRAGLCIDMCVDMCMDIPVRMCPCMCIDVCINMYTCMCVGVHMGMCIGMRMNMHIGMRTDVRKGIFQTNVYRRSSPSCRASAVALTFAGCRCRKNLVPTLLLCRH